ncbi:arylamine N-acetyltransferase [Neobacillus mesonae]|nr:arylamine N-acetyltransferase [Neobacillus mesonae]
MITLEEIKSYLSRLGITDIQAPTKEYLFELNKAHLAHISWQTLDIFAGRPSSIDTQASVQLMINRRSGYCFHLNGAFGTLLQALGYKVNWHRAGVQPMGQEPRINGFHLGMTVTLPNDEGIEEPWIVDVGLGDMLYEPIPLKFGTYSQGHFVYELVESKVMDGGWRLTHDPLNSYEGVDYAPNTASSLMGFQENHNFYSRSPESPWLNQFLLRLRNEKEIHELKGCIWKKWDQNGVHKTEIVSKKEWIEILADIFHEDLILYSSLEREEIWKKLFRLHEQWRRDTERQHT